MKRVISILIYLLTALVVFLPFGVVSSSNFGYRFELFNYSFFAIVTALLSICIVILSIDAKETVENNLNGVLFSILTPLSLINSIFYMLECSSIWVIASVFICAGSCCYMTIKHGRPLALKMTVLIISAFMFLPISFFGFISLVFGNIGQNTVIQSVLSPDGTYYAEVIDSDQGALGGDTFVDVYENRGINALVFRIFKEPKRVYYGAWGEFKNMEISWKDDNCLVINSVEYEMAEVE